MEKGQRTVLALLTSVLVLTGCMTASTPAVRAAGDVDLTVTLAGAPAEAVEVSISGEGMDSPILADLDVVDDVARGTVDEVEAGPDRSVVVTAFGSDGARCSGAVMIDIEPGQVTAVDDLALVCFTGGIETSPSSRISRASTVASIEW